VIIMDFDKMLQFVKKTLEDNNAIKSKNIHHQFRSRYTHTIRVLNWAKRISSDLKCNTDILYTACIFHDVGYAWGKENHALISSKIFEEYAKDNNLDNEFVKEVSRIISLHSNKELLNDKDSTPELILLLEADLLDEEGALGIVWDLLAYGSKGSSDYESALGEIYIHSGHILSQDFMVTEKAKEYWNKKKELVKNFIDSYKMDLFIE